MYKFIKTKNELLRPSPRPLRRPKEILRIENKNGQGPFSSNDTLSLAPAPTKFWPLPMEDATFWQEYSLLPESERRSFVFGFKSMRQLKMWFTESQLKTLEKQGFTIRRVPTQNLTLILGTSQVAFKP